jgi:hypothetical protein
VNRKIAPTGILMGPEPNRGESKPKQAGAGRREQLDDEHHLCQIDRC